MLTRFLILLLTGVAVYGGNVQGRDIFVNNKTGDNRRDGSSAVMVGQAGGPCRSIGRALELAKNGDRIIVAATGEPYRESITLQASRHSGDKRRSFEIIGNGAVLDGSHPVPKNVWQHIGDEVYRFRPSRMAYHNLFLDDKPVARKKVKRGELLPKLEPLEWCLFERHVYFRPEPGRMPHQYALSHTTLPVGISLYEARHIVIQDLVVQGFQLDGVNAHDSVFNTTLVGLTCRGNGRSGIAVNGASRIKIIACLVGDNGTAQVLVDGYSHTEIINCNLIPKSAPSVLRLGGEVLVYKDGAEVQSRR